LLSSCLYVARRGQDVTDAGQQRGSVTAPTST
jgi:hypothetical protein